MSEWTLETLKEHFDIILSERDQRYTERASAQEKAINAALAAQEKATTTALTAADRANDTAQNALDKRLDGLNELRQIVVDLQQGYMSRRETQALLDAMVEKIDNIRLLQNQSIGKGAGLHAGYGYIAGGIGILLGIGGLLLNLLT